MSTGKTANLELNQWALDDDFLMEEFNADNRKTDTAVKAAQTALAAAQTALEAKITAIPYVKLMEITTSSDAKNVSLNVSSIDFSKYAAVQIFADAVVRDSSNTLGNGYQAPYLGMIINSSGGNFDVEGSSNNASYNYVARVPQAYYSTCSMQVTVSGFYSHPSATNGTAYYHSLTVHCVAASNCEPVNTTSACNFGDRNTPLQQFLFFAGANDASDFKIKANSRFAVYGVKR